MPLTSSRPLTPGQRFLTRNKQEVSDKKPERRLTKHCISRRAATAMVASHHVVVVVTSATIVKSISVAPLDIPAKVQAIEYDPTAPPTWFVRIRRR